MFKQLTKTLLGISLIVLISGCSDSGNSDNDVKFTEAMVSGQVTYSVQDDTATTGTSGGVTVPLLKRVTFEENGDIREEMTEINPECVIEWTVEDGKLNIVGCGEDKTVTLNEASSTEWVVSVHDNTADTTMEETWFLQQSFTPEDLSDAFFLSYRDTDYKYEFTSIDGRDIVNIYINGSEDNSPDVECAYFITEGALEIYECTGTDIETPPHYVYLIGRYDDETPLLGVWNSWSSGGNGEYFPQGSDLWEKDSVVH